MIRNRPTQGDAEIRLKVVRYLGTRASLIRGESVYYMAPNDPSAGTTPNGIYVTSPAPATLRVITLYAGIVYDDAGIASGAWGQIQTSGFANYARVAGDPGVPTIVGDYLQGVPGFQHLSRGTTAGTYAVSLEAFAAGVALAARSILLRCPE